MDDLHDALQSYYKVTRIRFVDAICLQVVDDHLICSQSSPLKKLSPTLVSSFSDEELERLACESRNTKSRRMELQKELSTLEQGARVLSA